MLRYVGVRGTCSLGLGAAWGAVGWVHEGVARVGLRRGCWDGGHVAG